jgi:hypothetical protein
MSGNSVAKGVRRRVAIADAMAPDRPLSRLRTTVTTNDRSRMGCVPMAMSTSEVRIA